MHYLISIAVSIILLSLIRSFNKERKLEKFINENGKIGNTVKLNKRYYKPFLWNLHKKGFLWDKSNAWAEKRQLFNSNDYFESSPRNPILSEYPTLFFTLNENYTITVSTERDLVINNQEKKLNSAKALT